MSAKVINWFEIPVADINRAIKFYQSILSITLSPMEMGGTKLAMFPVEGQTGGALVQGEGYVPSKEGSLVYLNADSGMEEILSHISDANGDIIMSKTSIGEFGYIGRFIDSEGNLIALHSVS